MGSMNVTVRRCTDFDSRRTFVTNRRRFQTAFVQHLLSRAKKDCVILDIGCGCSRPEFLRPVEQIASALDGVDPNPDVARHPALRNHWHGTLEEADIPHSTYDIAFAYNVVEHVSTPVPFLEKVHRILKPGGYFLALTPHALHPFPRAVRLVERLSLKQRAATMHSGINDYPAYYRMNSRSTVCAQIPIGFSDLTIWRLPCRHWDRYFPRPLRFVPLLYDILLGDWADASMLLFMFELRK